MSFSLLSPKPPFGLPTNRVLKRTMYKVHKQLPALGLNDTPFSGFRGWHSGDLVVEERKRCVGSIPPIQRWTSTRLVGSKTRTRARSRVLLGDPSCDPLDVAWVSGVSCGTLAGRATPKPSGLTFGPATTATGRQMSGFTRVSSKKDSHLSLHQCRYASRAVPQHVSPRLASPWFLFSTWDLLCSWRYRRVERDLTTREFPAMSQS